MKKTLKSLAASVLLALPIIYQDSHAQNSPTPTPYDLRISGKVLDDQNQETRDLTPGKTYTLEILAENPFGTNSTTRFVNLGFKKPAGVTIKEAFQPSPYYRDDFFTDLEMDSFYNATWTDGEILQLSRMVKPSETRPTLQRGVIGRYTFTVNETESVKSELFLHEIDISALDGIAPNMRSLKTGYRELLTATIPTNHSTNIYVFYDTNNGENPSLNGNIPSLYTSAKNFGGIDIILEGSEDLTNWMPLSTNRTGSFEFTDLEAQNSNSRFYRIKKE
ncbi:MAG: hypothetical protein Q8Q31_04555 [Nanoarchaeota archaeon]|nr:hypothetical protein [Nanoarchaeota archaeon]